MSKLASEKAVDFTVPLSEEGRIISDQEQDSTEYVEIPIVEVFRGLGKVIQAYAEYSSQAAGFAKVFIETQKATAENLQQVFKAMANFDGVSVVIQRHIDSELSKLGEIDFQETSIYIQPTTPYVPPPVLPHARRKRQFPTTAIQIKNKGFLLQDQYITGLTINSKPGGVLTVLIRQDLMGVIDDSLLYKAARIDDGEYEQLAIVLRDLKDILAGNKIKINLKRQRGIQRYEAKSITKYIRKPKKKKKTVKAT